MNIERISPILWALELGERLVVYTSPNGVEVSATRTDKVCPHDFAVGLTIPGRPIFFPTHVRLFVDFYLKRLSNSQLAIDLFRAVERVYNDADPDTLRSDWEHVRFPMQFDEAQVNIYYAQLLMVEQDFNYGPQGCKKSNVNPPREFLMRFVRWIASGDDEIDRIITNAVRNWPPPVRYRVSLLS